MNIKNNKFISWIKSPASDVVLFIVAIILLNLVSIRAFFRIDLTRSGSYSLSPASKELVKTIEEPLNIEVFFSDDLPAQYASVYQYVSDILVEYKNASNGNLSYEFHDMNSPEFQDLARSYGIYQMQIREVANNEFGLKAVYMGMAFTYADQMEKLDGVTSTGGLEYNITNAISKVISNTNALSGLQDDVVVTLYRSTSLEAFNINGFDEMDSSVKSAFDYVNAKFQNRMTFKVEDVSSSQAKDLAGRYGFQSMTWRTKNGNSENAALGLVVETGNKFRCVPLEMVNMIFGYAINGLDNLEESLTESVRALVSKSTKIGYVTNHFEMSIDDAESGAGNFSGLFDSRYTFEKFDLEKDNIPAGVMSVMLNGPKFDLTDNELYKLDQFLMKGGNLILIVDPFEIDEGSYNNQTNYNVIDSRLNVILEKYGIKTDTAYIFDEDCYEQTTDEYGQLNFFYVPVVSDKYMNQKHPISKNLGYVLFYVPGPVDASAAKENKNLKVTTLASTSPKSWTVSDNITLSPFGSSVPSSEVQRSYDIAVLVEGNFESAFSGKPDAMSSEDGLSSDSYVSKSVQSGKIFVGTSSHITGPQVLQPGSSEPIAVFLQNVVDYMNGNEELCGMRSKGMALNTLHLPSSSVVNFVKYFNIAGLAVLLALAGLVIMLLRNAHRKEIRMRYDADDAREVSK